MTVITRTPVKWEGTYPDFAIKQGWNTEQKKFWIQVTNRKNGITNRIYMDEEFYQNFHNMGNYIFKQHSEKDPDTEFEIKDASKKKCKLCGKTMIYSEFFNTYYCQCQANAGVRQTNEV